MPGDNNSFEDDARRGRRVGAAQRGGLSLDWGHNFRGNLTGALPADTSHSAWQSLRNLYEPKGFMASISLRRKMRDTVRKDEDSVDDYIAKMSEYKWQLSRMRYTMSDTVFAIALLSGMPDSTIYSGRIKTYCLLLNRARRRTCIVSSWRSYTKLVDGICSQS